MHVYFYRSFWTNHNPAEATRRPRPKYLYWTSSSSLLGCLSTRNRLVTEQIDWSSASSGTRIQSSFRLWRIILANVKQLWPVVLLLEAAEHVANALSPKILYLGGLVFRASTVFNIRFLAVDLGISHVECSKRSLLWISIIFLRPWNNSLLDKPDISFESWQSTLTLPSFIPGRTKSYSSFATKSINHIFDLLRDIPSRTRKACSLWFESGSRTKEIAQHSFVMIRVGSISLCLILGRLNLGRLNLGRLNMLGMFRLLVSFIFNRTETICISWSEMFNWSH